MTGQMGRPLCRDAISGQFYQGIRSYTEGAETIVRNSMSYGMSYGFEEFCAFIFEVSAFPLLQWNVATKPKTKFTYFSKMIKRCFLCLQCN